MSTFGGDSWVPENVYRKRRVDELLGEAIEEGDVRRLSNGKLACLVCPNYPVLDTMPLLIVHRKGAGHQYAAERKREKDQRLREEIQKRIALGSNAVPSRERPPSNSSTSRGGMGRKTTPLLAATEAIKAAALRGQNNAVAEAKRPRGSPLDNEVKPYIKKASSTAMESQTERLASSGSRLGGNALTEQTPLKTVPKVTPKSVPKSASRGQCHRETLVRSGPESAGEVSMQELYKARERELRLREAGWRRDGVGGWFRDENVEFDSDEEVPKNIEGTTLG